MCFLPFSAGYEKHGEREYYLCIAVYSPKSTREYEIVA